MVEKLNKRKCASKTINIGDVYTANCGTEAVVIEYENRLKVLVEFQDEVRFRKYFTARNIRQGEFKNPYAPVIYGIAYYGGLDSKTVKDKSTYKRCYRTWQNMLFRCYVKIENNKPYLGCSVDPRWHSFTNFYQWFIKQKFNSEDYHLDKDLLVRGNKIYSENFCCLLPRKINNLISGFSNIKVGDNVGTYFCKRDEYYICKIKMDGKDKCLGYFKTPEEANDIYIREKEAYTKEVAEDYKHLVTDEVYKALIGWTVYPK